MFGVEEFLLPTVIDPQHGWIQQGKADPFLLELLLHRVEFLSLPYHSDGEVLKQHDLGTVVSEFSLSSRHYGVPRRKCPLTATK